MVNADDCHLAYAIHLSVVSLHLSVPSHLHSICVAMVCEASKIYVLVSLHLHLCTGYPSGKGFAIEVLARDL